MPTAEQMIIALPPSNGDERVRIFRRSFSFIEELACMHVDTYAIITERYVIICDTLLTPADMAVVMHALQAELTAERQLLVINSHADWDHTWGNSYFSGPHAVSAAPIIAHQHCLVRMRSDEEQAELVAYQKRYDIFRSVVLTPPTITFTHDLIIQGGDLTLELISAPGHSPDHIAVWLPELRLLLAFDAAEYPLPCIENALGVQPLLATLEYFLALQPQRVLYSHSETDSPALLKENLNYLRELEQQCHTLLSTYRPTATELEHASALINYSLETLSGKLAPSEYDFYRQAHDNNVRAMMQWLMDYPL